MCTAQCWASTLWVALSRKSPYNEKCLIRWVGGKEEEGEGGRKGGREEERKEIYIPLSHSCIFSSFFLPFTSRKKITGKGVPLPSLISCSLSPETTTIITYELEWVLTLILLPTHTPGIVLVCAVRKTLRNLYYVERDVLHLTLLPLPTIFPRLIYVVVGQGSANFFP